MEAYYKEVHQLEDKFHGLELVHIARRYNEAADELAKIASTRGTIPPDAFSRDLHEPSVDLSLGLTSKPPPPSNRCYRSPASSSGSNGSGTSSRSTVRLVHAVS